MSIDKMFAHLIMKEQLYDEFSFIEDSISFMSSKTVLKTMNMIEVRLRDIFTLFNCWYLLKKLLGLVKIII